MTTSTKGKQQRCGHCRQPGHKRNGCPQLGGGKRNGKSTGPRATVPRTAATPTSAPRHPTAPPPTVATPAAPPPTVATPAAPQHDAQPAASDTTSSGSTPADADNDSFTEYPQQDDQAAAPPPREHIQAPDDFVNGFHGILYRLRPDADDTELRATATTFLSQWEDRSLAVHGAGTSAPRAEVAALYRDMGDYLIATGSAPPTHPVVVSLYHRAHRLDTLHPDEPLPSLGLAGAWTGAFDELRQESKEFRCAKCQRFVSMDGECRNCPGNRIDVTAAREQVYPRTDPTSEPPVTQIPSFGGTPPATPEPTPGSAHPQQQHPQPHTPDPDQAAHARELQKYLNEAYTWRKQNPVTPSPIAVAGLAALGMTFPMIAAPLAVWYLLARKKVTAAKENNRNIDHAERMLRAYAVTNGQNPDQVMPMKKAGRLKKLAGVA